MWRSIPESASTSSAATGGDSVVTAVREQRADLGLTDLPVPTDLVSHPLERQEIVLISLPGLDLPDPVPMSRLNGMRLVLPGQGSPRRREFDQIFSSYGVRPIPAVESDERAKWLPAVREGQASLLWYRGMAEQAARAGLVVRSLDPAPPEDHRDRARPQAAARDRARLRHPRRRRIRRLKAWTVPNPTCRISGPDLWGNFWIGHFPKHHRSHGEGAE